MPGGDRSGPMGQGPLTGWGRGPCGGGSPSTGFGFFGGRGRGGGGRGWNSGGRGWRNRYWATGRFGWMDAGVDAGDASLDRATEAQLLEQRCSALESELAMLKNRLAELDQSSENSD